MTKIYTGGTWVDLDPQMSAAVNQLQTDVSNKLDKSSVLRMVPTANSIIMSFSFERSSTDEVWNLSGISSGITPPTLDLQQGSWIRVCAYKTTEFPSHFFTVDTPFIGYKFNMCDTNNNVVRTVLNKNNTLHLKEETALDGSLVYIFDDWIPIPKQLNVTSAKNFQLPYPHNEDVSSNMKLVKMKWYNQQQYDPSRYQSGQYPELITVSFTPYTLGVDNTSFTDYTRIVTS